MITPNHYFNGRELVFVTQHQKHHAVFPILSTSLSCQLRLCDQLNTDQFGSFSGEVKRLDSAFQTALSKCDTAQHEFGYDLILASEGSFGSHPSIPFLPSNQELLVLKDYKYNFTASAIFTSLETNFSAETISSLNGLEAFAQKVNFPSHALILKDHQTQFSEVHKGLTHKETLQHTFKALLSKYGQAYVETDMRACYNPTRQNVIARTTQKLVKQLYSICPKCCLPGFRVTSVQKGLKCSACRFPTNSILYQECCCQNCNFVKRNYYPDDRLLSDPAYCNFCNP